MMRYLFRNVLQQAVASARLVSSPALGPEQTVIYVNWELFANYMTPKHSSLVDTASRILDSHVRAHEMEGWGRGEG